METVKSSKQITANCLLNNYIFRKILFLFLSNRDTFVMVIAKLSLVVWSKTIVTCVQNQYRK